MTRVSLLVIATWRNEVSSKTLICWFCSVRNGTLHNLQILDIFNSFLLRRLFWSNVADAKIYMMLETFRRQNFRNNDDTWVAQRAKHVRPRISSQFHQVFVFTDPSKINSLATPRTFKVWLFHAFKVTSILANTIFERIRFWTDMSQWTRDLNIYQLWRDLVSPSTKHFEINHLP